MYGLPQAGKIAIRLHTSSLHPGPLVTFISPHLLYPCRWWFSIKSEGIHHTNHLTNALRILYTITIGPTGPLHCGITLEWNYNKHYVDVSMTIYVTKVLHKFQHDTPSKPQHSPFKFFCSNYGSKIQYASVSDNLPLLSASSKNRV